MRSLVKGCKISITRQWWRVKYIRPISQWFEAFKSPLSEWIGETTSSVNQLLYCHRFKVGWYEQYNRATCLETTWSLLQHKLKVVVTPITSLFTKTNPTPNKLICCWLNKVAATSRSEIYILQQLFPTCNKNFVAPWVGKWVADTGNKYLKRVPQHCYAASWTFC